MNLNGDSMTDDEFWSYVNEIVNEAKGNPGPARFDILTRECEDAIKMARQRGYSRNLAGFHLPYEAALLVAKARLLVACNMRGLAMPVIAEAYRRVSEIGESAEWHTEVTTLYLAITARSYTRRGTALRHALRSNSWRRRFTALVSYISPAAGRLLRP